MYEDNSTNNSGNQPQGDNTPPPMLDTPVSTDPPASDPLSTAPYDTPNDSPQTDSSYPTTDDDKTSTSQVDNDFANPEPAKTTSGSTDDLLSIKQQALAQLTPLVGHLDQSPKEEFRTTMMMIQATDNQDLVKKAFEAAQKIDDDKERAQAFLDIINEINYFTQQHEQ